MKFRTLQQQHPRGAVHQHAMETQAERPGQQQDSSGPSRESKVGEREAAVQKIKQEVNDRMIHKYLSMGRPK